MSVPHLFVKAPDYYGLAPEGGNQGATNGRASGRMGRELRVQRGRLPEEKRLQEAAVRLRLMLLMVAMMLSVGCGPVMPAVAPTATPTATTPPTPSPTATMRATPTPTPLPTPPVVVEGLSLAPAQAAEPVLAAVSDLASRLDLPRESAVTVVEVQSQEWSDTSLGCPQPGMVYAQVITPGYRLVLEVKGERYEYHTDRGAHVVLCQSEEPTSGKGVSPTVKDGSPSEPVGTAEPQPTPGRTK